MFSPGIALDVLFAGAQSVIVLLPLLSSLTTELPELLPLPGTTWAAHCQFTVLLATVWSSTVQTICQLLSPQSCKFRLAKSTFKVIDIVNVPDLS